MNDFFVNMEFASKDSIEHKMFGYLEFKEYSNCFDVGQCQVMDSLVTIYRCNIYDHSCCTIEDDVWFFKNIEETFDWLALHLNLPKGVNILEIT